MSSQEQHHQCQLETELDKYFPRLPAYASWQKHVEYWFRYAILIDDDHILTQRYFRSRASVAEEKIRHIRDHPNIIHPFSRLHRTVQKFEFLLLSIAFAVDPVCMAFANLALLAIEDPICYPITRLKIVYDLFLLMSISYQFHVGYYSFQEREVILERRKIASNYVRTLFVPDLVGTILYYFAEIEKSAIKNQSVLFLFTMFPYVRVTFRIQTMIEFGEIYLQQHRMSDVLRKSVKYLITLLFLVHWWACTLSVMLVMTRDHYRPDLQRNYRRIQSRYNNDDTSRYIGSFMCIVGSLFSILTSHCPVFPTVLQQLIIALALGLGFMYTATAIAVLLQYYVDTNQYKEAQERCQIHNFCHANNLPHELTERLLTYQYYRHNLRRATFEDRALTQNLQHQIHRYRHNELVRQIRVFDGLSGEIFELIIEHVHFDVFLCGDVIVDGPNYRGDVYFIRHGTAAVYYRRRYEILHLEDGDEFGNEFYLLKQKGDVLGERIHVVALEVMEIFRIGRTRLFRCLQKDYARILLLINQWAMDRIVVYKKRAHQSQIVVKRTDVSSL